MKGRAAIGVVGRPETAAVGGDDRPADGQAEAHPRAVFVVTNGSKTRSSSAGGDARAPIGDRHVHGAVGDRGAEEEPPVLGGPCPSMASQAFVTRFRRTCCDLDAVCHAPAEGRPGSSVENGNAAGERGRSARSRTTSSTSSGSSRASELDLALLQEDAAGAGSPRRRAGPPRRCRRGSPGSPRDCRVSCEQVPLRRLRVAQDRGQRLVELVGERPRELAEHGRPARGARPRSARRCASSSAVLRRVTSIETPRTRTLPVRRVALAGAAERRSSGPLRPGADPVLALEARLALSAADSMDRRMPSRSSG